MSNSYADPCTQSTLEFYIIITLIFRSSCRL